MRLTVTGTDRKREYQTGHTLAVTQTDLKGLLVRVRGSSLAVTLSDIKRLRKELLRVSLKGVEIS